MSQHGLEVDVGVVGVGVVSVLLVRQGGERLARQPPEAVGREVARLEHPADVCKARVAEDAQPRVAGEPREARRGMAARHHVVDVSHRQRVVHEPIRVHVRPLRTLCVHRERRARARQHLAALAAANSRAL